MRVTTVGVETAQMVFWRILIRQSDPSCCVTRRSRDGDSNSLAMHLTC